jgi:hypothetical protein
MKHSFLCKTCNYYKSGSKNAVRRAKEFHKTSGCVMGYTERGTWVRPKLRDIQNGTN